MVEVDTKTLALKVDEKILNIRVNRDKLRTSWDGVSYRSYTAAVAVNCDLKNARYLSLIFYLLPLWEGLSHKTSTYSELAVRPMLFRDMDPNPTERIIKAACFASGRQC